MKSAEEEEQIPGISEVALQRAPGCELQVCLRLWDLEHG